jgi:hypothetical protein
MQIAFDPVPPDKSKVAALIAASGLEGRWDAETFFDAPADACRFVAAYDRDGLVGLGRKTGGHSEGGIDIVVLPDYRHRDIVSTIFKLLSGGRKPETSGKT